MQYFLNYNECLSNDFVFSNGGKHLELANSDIHDWQITYRRYRAPLEYRTTVADRGKICGKYVAGEEVFLANYSDGLTDLDFLSYLDFARQRNKIATFLSVKPNLSYHVAKTDADGLVTGVKDVTQSGIRINAGFFVLIRGYLQIHEARRRTCYRTLSATNRRSAIGCL
jgi:glucose-1-phosphate cytidylyltransferase